MHSQRVFSILSGCLTLFISSFSCGEVLPLEHSIIGANQVAVNTGLELLTRNFSWEDPAIQNALWAGKKREAMPVKNGEARWSIGKRSAQPQGAPLINIPCIGCADSASPQLDTELASLTAQKMATLIKSSGAVGSCLFYGQRPEEVWKPSGIRSLSAATTSFACSTLFAAYRTIWMLWPYQSDNDAKPYSNFYCLNPWDPVETCWLNGFLTGVDSDSVARKKAALPYFRAMSKAMALTCRGEVFIAADDPDRITEQFPGEETKSIWLTHELPTLQYLYQNGKQVTKLTVLQVSHDQVGTSNNVDKTSVLAAPIPPGYSFGDGGNTRRALKFLLDLFTRMEEEGISADNSTHWLNKRDCPSTNAFESPNQDNFG